MTGAHFTNLAVSSSNRVLVTIDTRGGVVQRAQAIVRCDRFFKLDAVGIVRFLIDCAVGLTIECGINFRSYISGCNSYECKQANNFRVT